MPDVLRQMCFDDRQRKIIVGEAAGLVTVYNYLNGVAMKQVPWIGHRRPIGHVRCRGV